MAVADSWKNSNLLIEVGTADQPGCSCGPPTPEWVHGDGPEVSGPLLSLILAMTGRKGDRTDTHR